MARSSDYFRDGGILSERIPSFRYRPCQEGMAELVEEALDNSEHAVIEAGTGTGKSYAYIVPLLLRAKERLGKEIPLVIDVVVADELKEGATATVCMANEVPEDKMISTWDPRQGSSTTRSSRKQGQ